jgi:hypothetical protein
MSAESLIKRGQSCAKDAREAAREFRAAVAQPEMALVLFFCSSEYDLDELAAAMNKLFAGVQVVGCTTAGEIGPIGYLEHSLTGASFSARVFTAATARIDHLREFRIAEGPTLVQDLLQNLESQAPQANADNSFAFLMIDGLAEREEPVTRALQAALGKLPLFGGSAGDGLNFGRTHVFFDGGFHSDSAVLVLATTPLPFRIFKTQHFVASDKRVVVTDADAEHRLVREINGRPAAEAYAELVGVDIHQLDSMGFAASPLVVVIDGTSYVRSLQKVNPDGSLTFFCAIDEGMVLRMARGVDLMENLEQAFAANHTAIGEPQLVIGCDCILRRLEIVKGRLVERATDLFLRNKVIGFSTYGEQYRGVHVNQTLTGIVIGSAETEAQGA